MVSFVVVVVFVVLVLFVTRGARTVALTQRVLLTVGSLTLDLDLIAAAVLLLAAVSVVFVPVAFFPRTVATAFFTPALIAFDVTTLRFLLWVGSLLSTSSETFRFLPITLAAAAFFGLPSAFRFSSSSLARCSFSFKRGPRKPRQFAEPQRHAWTFLLEYGLR